MAKGKGFTGDIHPAVEHVFIWFNELSGTRGMTVVAGMGGGGSFPSPITFTEIDSWANRTHNDPTAWEVRQLRSMDEAYLAAYHGKPTGEVARHQALGEYCQGKEIENCRLNFGDSLEHVCATCPN